MHLRSFNGAGRGTGAARFCCGLAAVLRCWLLGLCDCFRQTEAAISAKPVAVAVLLLVSHGARLAVVAIDYTWWNVKGVQKPLWVAATWLRKSSGEETQGGRPKQHPSSLREDGDGDKESLHPGGGRSSRCGTSAGGRGHDSAGGTSGYGGGHGAGGATGAAVVVEVDGVRLWLASAMGSYRCLLVGDWLSVEERPCKIKYLAGTHLNSSTTIRSKFSRCLVLVYDIVYLRDNYHTIIRDKSTIHYTLYTNVSMTSHDSDISRSMPVCLSCCTHSLYPIHSVNTVLFLIHILLNDVAPGVG